MGRLHIDTLKEILFAKSQERVAGSENRTKGETTADVRSMNGDERKP
jgi:hypothetical protein